MGGGMRQMLFVMAAMALLSQITMMVNSYVGQTFYASLTSEATITATGIAQALLAEVSTKAFDEKALVAGANVSVDSLTAPGYLSAEGGETYPNFDDIDDFNLYQRVTTTPRLGNFRVQCAVWYVTNVDLDSPQSVRTFLKRVTVIVDQNLGLEYDVSMTRILTY